MRNTSIVSKLVTAAYEQLELDKGELSRLKAKVIENAGRPDELLSKSINAMRTTIANGREDLEDLEEELKRSVAFEASEVGQARRAALHDKLLVADAMVDVCLKTANDCDIALNRAWRALRRHKAAHDTLHDAFAGAYTAMVEGTGFDPHQDQLYLLQTWMNLNNNLPALGEFVEESLRGYNLQEYIKITGLTLNHNVHETMAAAEQQALLKAHARLREIAMRTGHVAPAEDHPALSGLRKSLLDAVGTLEVK